MKKVFTWVLLCGMWGALWAYEPEDSIVQKKIVAMHAVAELWETSGLDDTMMCSYYCRNFNRRPVCMHLGMMPPGSEFDFVAAEEGDILGPYVFGNSISLYKFVDRVNKPDSVRFSQILVTYKGAREAEPYVTRSKEQAKKRADSLCYELRVGKIFMDEIMVAESDDVSGLIRNYGNYGWITRASEHPQNVLDAAFDTPPGSFTIAESDRGYHVIKIEEFTAMWDCFRAWEIRWTIDSCYDVQGKTAIKSAVYPGGISAFTDWLQFAKFQYDSLDVGGRFDYPVLVVFDVMPDGTVDNVGVFRQNWVTPGVVYDITRLFRSCPKWVPAQSCNGPVREEQSVIVYL